VGVQIPPPALPEARCLTLGSLAAATMRQTEIVGELLCPVLVGRRAEIQVLESALAGMLAGQGGCAVITGEVGIGISSRPRPAGQPEMPGTATPRRWLFLGVLLDVLTEPGAPVAVAEAVLPEGASPPAHLHAALDDSFLAAVREIGRPATGTDVPAATPGPTIEELDQAFAAHGITNVGPPMEQPEAERLLGQLAGKASPD
jgi:hypothetical protein